MVRTLRTAYARSYGNGRRVGYCVHHAFNPRLDFGGKRRALFDLLRHRTVPLDQFDEIGKYLMIPHNLTRLRDDIAHTTWSANVSSRWIQPDWSLQPVPSIKPLREEIGMHDEKFIERNEDKIGYTVDDLEQSKGWTASAPM
jgi:hypothetical protein